MTFAIGHFQKTSPSLSVQGPSKKDFRREEAVHEMQCAKVRPIGDLSFASVPASQ